MPGVESDVSLYRTWLIGWRMRGWRLLTGQSRGYLSLHHFLPRNFGPLRWVVYQSWRAPQPTRAGHQFGIGQFGCESRSTCRRTQLHNPCKCCVGGYSGWRPYYTTSCLPRCERPLLRLWCCEALFCIVGYSCDTYPATFQIAFYVQSRNEVMAPCPYVFDHASIMYLFMSNSNFLFLYHNFPKYILQTRKKNRKRNKQWYLTKSWRNILTQNVSFTQD